jgi:hypothetical protein
MRPTVATVLIKKPAGTPSDCNAAQNEYELKKGHAMATKSRGPISFDLSPEQAKALEVLAGGRQVRLSGMVRNGRLIITFVACNAPFIACNAPFTACNAPFAACNAPFKKD